MSIVIRKAKESDLGAVEDICREIHRAEEEGKITTGWIRGVYPTRAVAKAALGRAASRAPRPRQPGGGREAETAKQRKEQKACSRTLITFSCAVHGCII